MWHTALFENLCASLHMCVCAYVCVCMCACTCIHACLCKHECIHINHQASHLYNFWWVLKVIEIYHQNILGARQELQRIEWFLLNLIIRSIQSSHETKYRHKGMNEWNFVRKFNIFDVKRTKHLLLGNVQSAFSASLCIVNVTDLLLS